MMNRRAFFGGGAAAAATYAPAVAAPAPISFEDILAQKTFSMVSAGNGRWVTVAADRNVALHAIANGASRATQFKLVPTPGGAVKIFSVLHRGFVSAVGMDWPLLPQVHNEDWTRFVVTQDSQKRLIFRSTHPIAATGPVVSVIGESRVLRIAEAAPREPWSYFIPYRV